MEIKQMKSKGSEKKSNNKRVSKSNKKINSLPNELDNKACKRLICAILNQAWRDSKDNNYNSDIPSFLESKLCDSLCCYADIDTKEYKEVVNKRLEFAYKAKARALAEQAKDKIIENLDNNTSINGCLIEWDMEKRIVYVTIDKYIYCGHITDDFKFIGWKIDGTTEEE